MHRPGCRFWLALSGLVVLFAGLATVWLFSAVPDTKELEETWKRQAGYDPLEVYRGRETNAAALKIEELISELGFNARAQDWQGDIPQELVDGDQALRRYLLSLRSPEAAVPQVPPEVAGFLERLRPTLMHIAETLASDPPPQWHLYLDGLHEDQMPNLLTHLRLNRILLAAAAEAEGRQDTADRDRWLEAAWALRDAIAQDPRLLSQLIARAQLQDQSALLRMIEGSLPGWPERLSAIPLRAQTLNSLRIESWHAIQFLRPGGLGDLCRPGVSRGWLCRPRARLGAAQMVESMDRAANRLAQSDLRTLHQERLGDDESARTFRWNSLARHLMPNFLDPVIKAVRTELDLELTRRILELRALQAAGDTEALAALGGRQPSTVDPGIDWIYQLEADNVVIRASEDLPSIVDHPLPLEVRLSH